MEVIIMEFEMQRFADALPEFGLMTRADKQKLDSISTDALLTKAAASDTYATKTDLNNCIANVVESDTGVVFLNGNGETVYTLAKMGGGGR